MAPDHPEWKEGEWHEYRRLVMMELTRLVREIDDLREEISMAKTNIALLQLKASVWGAIAGAVVAIGAVLLRYAMQ